MSRTPSRGLLRGRQHDSHAEVHAIGECAAAATHLEVGAVDDALELQDAARQCLRRATVGLEAERDRLGHAAHGQLAFHVAALAEQLQGGGLRLEVDGRVVLGVEELRRQHPPAEPGRFHLDALGVDVGIDDGGLRGVVDHQLAPNAFEAAGHGAHPKKAHAELGAGAHRIDAQVGGG